MINFVEKNPFAGKMSEKTIVIKTPAVNLILSAFLNRWQ